MFPTSATYIAELGNTRVRWGEVDIKIPSRDALRAGVLPVIAREKRQNNPAEPRTVTPNLDCFAEPVIGPTTSGRTGWLAMTKRGSGTPADVCYPSSASCDAARALISFFSPACGGGLGGGALACGRSTTALTVGAFALSARLQARFPGTWQERFALSRSPQPGGEGLSASPRALPAPACPSPGMHLSDRSLVPADMMPEAARGRTVSVRPRAPHPLRIREYPRPKASLK
jgi:hypothetical protein